MSIEEVRCERVDWIRLAQQRAPWWAFMNTPCSFINVEGYFDQLIGYHLFIP
jgi:hypothetical protein